MSSMLRPVTRALRQHAYTASTTSTAVRSMSLAPSRFDHTARLADESVLDHIVCPISKYPLRYDTERGSLVCDEIKVEYPIWEGVPMLVPTEGRIIKSSDDSHE